MGHPPVSPHPIPLIPIWRRLQHSWHSDQCHPCRSVVRLVLGFQFPDYQITQLPNPGRGNPPASSHPIPTIPIWRGFLRCTPDVRQKVYPHPHSCGTAALGYSDSLSVPLCLRGEDFRSCLSPCLCVSVVKISGRDIGDYQKFNCQRTRAQPSLGTTSLCLMLRSK